MHNLMDFEANDTMKMLAKQETSTVDFEGIQDILEGFQWQCFRDILYTPVILAFQLGYIAGKRAERKKKNP